jgi:hypothetical protein
MVYCTSVLTLSAGAGQRCHAPSPTRPVGGHTGPVLPSAPGGARFLQGEHWVYRNSVLMLSAGAGQCFHVPVPARPSGGHTMQARTILPSFYGILLYVFSFFILPSIFSFLSLSFFLPFILPFNILFIRFFLVFLSFSCCPVFLPHYVCHPSFHLYRVYPIFLFRFHGFFFSSSFFHSASVFITFFSLSAFLFFLSFFPFSLFASQFSIFFKHANR